MDCDHLCQVLPLWAFDQFIITWGCPAMHGCTFWLQRELRQPGEEVPDMTSPDFPEYGSRRCQKLGSFMGRQGFLKSFVG